MNQNEIPVDLSLIMTLTSMKILTNLAHLQYQCSTGINYVLNEHEDVDQYVLFAIPYDIMLYQSNPESLVNQNEILIELSY